MIYLIGAGPGDPGLLTIKGAQCIREADVLIYDRLSSERILRLAQEQAELIYVGKAPGHHAKTQDEINALLVAYGQQGKCVARIKGGDPFVFGRGGEEALALKAAGLEYEIVPGVSSAIAAAAYAGIPVTHRELSRSFHVITGHEKGDQLGLDFPTLARLEGTLVFVMGMDNLSRIVDGLLAAGKAADTPAAIVQSGTTSQQKHVVAPLSELCAQAAQAGLTNPALIIVGAVASLAQQLSWFGQQPLHGRRVAVTRSREQAGALSARLEELGAEVVEFPLIRIAPDAAALAQAAATPADVLVFTSANGVNTFFDYLREQEIDVRSLATAQLFAVGPGTEQALRQRGLRCQPLPEKFTGSALAEMIVRDVRPNARISLLRSDISARETAAELEQAGFAVCDFPVYRTLADDRGAAEFLRLDAEGGVDYLTFTSSSTVRNFVRATNGRLPQARIVCIGSVTAQTATAAGLPVCAIADEHTIDGLVCKILELAAAKN